MEKNFSKRVQTPIGYGQHRKKSKILGYLKWAVLGSGILLLGLILFIKFDTGDAAALTDNVLRPILGADRVLFLESIFFNTSDEIKKLTFNPDSEVAPQFNDQNSGSNISGGKLDLDPLAVNSKFKPLAGEGVWHNHPLALFPGEEVMADTFIRSDPDRPYSITTLVQIDMSRIGIGSVAGKKQPGGPVGKPGPGIVPKDIVESGRLVAAFDGGFQYKDGQYGMIVGNTTYLPLKNDLGTFVDYQDGSLKIFDYTGQEIGNANFVRQNCPMLITDGRVTVADERSRALWGRLALGTTDIFTWRSGVGLTAKGNLIFAVGNNLTPQTLAQALQSAGAVNAIQLDINPIWVRFNIFKPTGPGTYSSVPLTHDLADGSKQFLNGYDKDFFYLYKK